MDKLMDFIFEYIFPLIFVGVLFFVFLCVICAATHDYKGDRESLARCGDEYRACIKTSDGCLTKFNACRQPFSTDREEWAKVLGDSQTLNAIESEHRTQSAATTGALVGGMIGAHIVGGR